MLILFTAFADIYYECKKKFVAATVIYLVPVAAMLVAIFKTLPAHDSFAGAMSTFLPINKGSVSPSYVLISIALALIAIRNQLLLPQIAAAAISGISFGVLLSVFYLLCAYVFFRRKQRKNDV